MRHIKKLMMTLFIFLVVGLLLPLNVSAVTRTTIKLGYYDRPGFMEGMSDDVRKSGYAYDYLQRISDYTGWKYEYVYAELADLYQMMENGEVDIIAGVVPGENLPVKMEFANQALGHEKCNIYKFQDDESMKPGFVASLIGKKIGVLKNSLGQSYMEKFLEENLVTCEVLEFNTQDGLKIAMDNRDIDVFVAMDTNAYHVPNITSCLTISEDDYYVCVSPGKRTILRELNEADAQLRSDDPHFLEQLYSKYYQSEVANLNQSSKEGIWLRLNDTLRIGYLNDYLPFCAEEDGEVVGLLKDYIDNLKAQPELESLNIEAIAYDSVGDCYDDLQNGVIHTMFPAYQDVWYSEGLNLRESTTVFSQTVDLIFKGTYSEEVTKTIALNADGTTLNGYIARYFPDSEIKNYDTWEACIEAVKKGEASATLINRYKASQFLQQADNQILRFTSLPEPCGLAFAVETSDVELLSLLNRGIRLMGTEAIDTSVNRYIYYDFDYSFSGFLAANIERTIIFAVVFVTLLVALFLYYIHTTKKNQERMQKAQDELNEAKNQLTDALARADFANQSKTAFLFNMSHDIRTPMNAILGFAGLMEKHDDDPEKRHHYTENIKTAGGYLLDLINEVLEMARIESGKASLNEEEGDYIEMIDAVEIVLGNECNKKHHTLNKLININHKNLFFDFTKERTILMNIISNAIKYTPDGGKIDVLISECPGDDENTIIIESIIKDTGIGMSEEFLPHIFDSFSREKTATESKVIGTGLGMGIVKSYVELMGGTISVESKLGQGTCITIRIPHKIAHDYSSSHVDEIITSGFLNGKHVLLAEDNLLNQEIASEILQEVGLIVDVASDGEECVEVLSKNPAGTFDFILMDIQMPKMDGLVATETIRKMEDTAKASIPIIAMTANVFDTDKKRAFESGMDGFTGKPIQINELISDLNRVLFDKSKK